MALSNLLRVPGIPQQVPAMAAQAPAGMSSISYERTSTILPETRETVRVFAWSIPRLGYNCLPALCVVSHPSPELHPSPKVSQQKSVPPAFLLSPLTEKNVNSNCPSSLPAKKLEEQFDAIAAAKDLLESQEATSASLPPPPPPAEEEEEGEEREDSLEILVDTAPKELTSLPPSIHRGKAVSTSQLDSIEFLQATWKAYKKAQNDEEWDLLPWYIQTVIAQFRLVRSFYSWNETTDKIGGINPYTE
ncbi:hypothetical protein PCANC_28819 [Puccinia coronata f. sp. avenae]|uniref:Uncharacterized protein n=1 Tax=Puccinia coronata f. sp. avenae TaxID=200324 RepID=A0A2N5RWB8_9BASI|nr:hypothetical protein PCANC_28819 [Puccinia coronata f. sp. avenae]